MSTKKPRKKKMPNRNYAFTKEQINEVSKALAEEKNLEVHKRLQALSWLMEGKSLDEVVALSKIKFRSLQRIRANYVDSGLEGLKSKNKGGNSRKISRKREAEILENFKERANKGEFLRGTSLQAEFEKEAGATWHENNFYKILNRHGWRKVMPRSKHPNKASDETIEVSKKLTLV